MSADAKSPIRALTLLSGGLDSQLAVCVLREQGVEVHAVAFESPFFEADAARKAAGGLGIPLLVVDFGADIVELVEKPRHGFGAGMNPCIDCHARMLRRAGEILAREGCQFLSTGEVLNERPMSQNRTSLQTVARESGYEDLILRPLSAGLLPATRPEREGWVDRSKLLSLQGRGRKEQFRLAEHYGIVDYPTPAGGCRLTEPNFAHRLRDLRAHEGLRDARALQLLRVGRHFRLADHVKVVIGRHRQDNEWLESHAGPDDWVMKAEGVPGPTAIVPASASEAQLTAAAALCARYSDSKPGIPVAVRIRSAGGTRCLSALPADPEEVERCRV